MLRVHSLLVIFGCLAFLAGCGGDSPLDHPVTKMRIGTPAKDDVPLAAPIQNDVPPALPDPASLRTPSAPLPEAPSLLTSSTTTATMPKSENGILPPIPEPLKLPETTPTGVLPAIPDPLRPPGIRPESSLPGNPIDQKALKDLIPRPRMDFKSGIGFNSENGFYFANETFDHSAEIVALEKSLKGDLGDAERYCRLCELYSSDEKIKEAGARALELAKRRHSQNPNDAKNMIGLGRAYAAVHQIKQAEAFFRQAVKLSPSDPEAWLALGQCLQSIAYRETYGDKTLKFSLSFFEEPPKAPIDGPQSPEKLAAMNVNLAEAGECFDRAVRLGPNDPNMYYGRAGFRFARIMLTSAGKANPSDMLNLCLHDDWQSVARLSPESPRAIGFVANEVLLASGTPFRVSVSAEKKKALDQRLSQLDKLVSHQDPRIAADAQLVRAYFHMFLNMELEQAAPLLRQALKARPTHIPTLDLYEFCLGLQDDWKGALAIAEARLRNEDQPPIRFRAAMEAFELGDFSRAEQYLRTLLKSDPNNVDCNLGLAAVLLKRYDIGLNDEIRERLFQAESRLPESGYTNRSIMIVIRSIFSALAGDVESAQQSIQKLTEQDPQDLLAPKVAKVLGKKIS